MLEIERCIPQENWYVGLLFDEGYFFFKTIRKQQMTVYMPYRFNSDVPMLKDAVLPTWVTPTDALGRFYLEPQTEPIIYQFFTGFAPSMAKLYLQYTQREDRLSLITPRPVPGVIGFWEGQGTPYQDPSPHTELWTVHDIVPYFNVENDCAEDDDILEYYAPDGVKIAASFWITPFSYQVIKDKEKVKSFLRGQKRCTVRTMGDPFRPIKAPAWLVEDYSEWMVQPEEI